MTETPALDEFADEARRFLDRHADRRTAEEFVWGEGADSAGILEEKEADQERVELEAVKNWRATLFDAGFGWITGPTRYGGRQLPDEYERTYRSIEAEYDVPSQAMIGIGLGMVAPTILAHGTDEVKDSYLRALYRGEIIACQLFSEPVAGSDLAGIQTRAIRDGDEWIVTGQKVWTSGAHYSDIGEIITRTSPDKPKHKGMTMFLVDMKEPGVESRPLRQMTGGASFNEVFFDEVRIPDSHRLGDVDEGWTVALTTLMNERASIGAKGGGGSLDMDRLIETARHYGDTGDPVVRQRLADVWINNEVARLTNLRALSKIEAGELPGPEMSIAKLALTANFQRTSAVVSEVLGPRLAADTGEWGSYAWSELVNGAPGLRVAGGTDEVMRNIVGERVLGLPKEPRGEDEGRR
ncbi:MAG: acyl-CoA dehydrogenase family protein [Acidimicrobiia bacterium]|nr:acyl-CoA dehydrogenase family protein [Acidimicrobiia bacterium]